MQYSDWNKEIEDYVTAAFVQHTDLRLFYHNIRHTREVVDRVIEIGSFYKLDERSMFVLTTAAWFHDIGYLFIYGKGHEEEGVRSMKNLLMLLMVPMDLIIKISGCIMATKTGANPATLLEEIVCDADTYHFGTPLFKETNLQVKKELEAYTGAEMKHWTESTLVLLKQHRFYTSYCRQKLTEGKKQNISWLRPWYAIIQDFFRVGH